MIDIVITYLNERDPKWQEDFKYWKEKEIKEGKASPDNRQAFGEERTREWDTLKYWFRGVENCCPWVNKVFLVVQNENHVPDWLNKDYEKLRIVYHNEYIPSELLPTFNAMTIGMYFPFIEDLSERYITSDDDYFFLNPIEKDRFFKFCKPVHLNNQMPYKIYDGGYLTGTDNVFYKALNNTLMFEYKVTCKKIKYGFYHLPVAHSKSFDKIILNKYLNEINKCNSFSKFRNENNLCPELYCDIIKLSDKVTWGNPYKNCFYCNLDSKVNFEFYRDKDIVCFNDTERLDDYETTKKKLIDFLESKFPEKSKFEN